jgi:glutamate-1-semialdehyde aminotransferase
MPLSILAGRADVMALLAREVFFYTTFGGEALSLAAAQATIGELRRLRVPARLAEAGARIRDGYNQLAQQHEVAGFTRCVGPACRTQVMFDASAGSPLELRSFAQQELIRRGVLWSGTHNVCYGLSDDDISYLLSAWDEVLGALRVAVSTGRVRELLRGEPVEPVFRRTSNFNLKPRVVCPTP